MVVEAQVPNRPSQNGRILLRPENLSGQLPTFRPVEIADISDNIVSYPRILLIERIRKGLERLTGMNFLQRRRGSLPDTVKWIVVQRLLQLSYRFLVLFLLKGFDGFQSPDHVIFIRQLLVQHRRRLIEGDVG